MEIAQREKKNVKKKRNFVIWAIRAAILFTNHFNLSYFKPHGTDIYCGYYRRVLITTAKTILIILSLVFAICTVPSKQYHRDKSFFFFALVVLHNFSFRVLFSGSLLFFSFYFVIILVRIGLISIERKKLFCTNFFCLLFEFCFNEGENQSAIFCIICKTDCGKTYTHGHS